MATVRILAATDAIYDAATGGTPWGEVGGALMGLTRARSISLMLGGAADGRSEILCHAEIPEEAAVAYRAHYRHVDLWTNRAAGLLAGRAAGGARVLASGEMLVPDAEFLRSEFYCDFGRHYGLRYVVGTVVPLGEAGVLPIGLHRPEGQERFGAAEKRVLEALLPHLRRALQIRHRLAVDANALAVGGAALDALALGVLVLDGEMRVVLANAAAEGMAAGGASGGALRLAAIQGAGVGLGDTVATPVQARERAALRDLVAATALGGGAGGALRLRDGGGEARLAALVCPLPARLAGRGGVGRAAGRALVLLRALGPGAALPRAEVLRDLFALTRAEAEIARALAGGATKAAVAAARGVSETTVRSHVRALLDKTGTANLRDLERLLAGLEGL